jgi:NAD(P)H-hydrate epimerase
MTYTGKLIIDADGLNTLAKYGVSILKNKSCQVLVTPHIKEFSRLSGKTVQEIVASPVECAKNFASAFGVTVLLKSATSVITDGTRTALNTTGNSALAKAGSGDMLAGFVGGSAARGLNLFDAACAGAFVMGNAAALSTQKNSPYAVVADDILSEVGTVIWELEKKNS